MVAHHVTARGLAVVAWADVPVPERASLGDAAEWMPQKNGESRQAHLFEVMRSPGCLAAVRPDPWWSRPVPWVPCRNAPTRGQWCHLHAPSRWSAHRPASVGLPGSAAYRVGDC